MDNSTNSVYVRFDKVGILERTEPDILREITQWLRIQ